MKNWKELSSMEERKVWERLYKEFRFNLRMTSFPSYKVPHPYLITIHIRSINNR